MKRKKCLWGIFSVLIIGACTHEPVVPATPEVSFAEQVSPIFISNCATSDCHDGREEFALFSYQDIRSHVKPGDANGSALYEAITTLEGEEAMPPAGPLSDEQITLIYVWIIQGAKEN